MSSPKAKEDADEKEEESSQLPDLVLKRQNSDTDVHFFTDEQQRPPLDRPELGKDE